MEGIYVFHGHRPSSQEYSAGARGQWRRRPWMPPPTPATPRRLLPILASAGHLTSASWLAPSAASISLLGHTTGQHVRTPPSRSAADPIWSPAAAEPDSAASTSVTRHPPPRHWDHDADATTMMLEILISETRQCIGRISHSRQIYETMLFSCGTSKESDSHLVAWNETEGAIKRTYKWVEETLLGSPNTSVETRCGSRSSPSCSTSDPFIDINRLLAFEASDFPLAALKFGWQWKSIKTTECLVTVRLLREATSPGLIKVAKKESAGVDGGAGGRLLAPAPAPHPHRPPPPPSPPQLATPPPNASRRLLEICFSR